MAQDASFMAQRFLARQEVKAAGGTLRAAESPETGSAYTRPAAARPASASEPKSPRLISAGAPPGGRPHEMGPARVPISGRGPGSGPSALNLAPVLGSALPGLAGFVSTGSITGALGPVASIAGQFLPQGVGQVLSMGQPFLPDALGSLLSGDGGAFSAIDDLSGFVAGSLPGPAGDAAGIMAKLGDGLNPLGMLSGLAGQFMPPELQGVWSAVQKAGGLHALHDLAFGDPSLSISDSQANLASGGLWAARVGDFHSCPMSDGPKPHVGGPILPPACVSVLIGGSPAARITDKAFCVGPPDVIASGEPTVLIGSLAAARRSDTTVHGGAIQTGCPTVWIGKKLASTAAELLAQKCSATAQESGVAGTV